jgi:hypothetical protein
MKGHEFNQLITLVNINNIMIYQDSLSINTAGRGSYDVTAEVQRVVRASGVATGLCTPARR